MDHKTGMENSKYDTLYVKLCVSIRHMILYKMVLQVSLVLMSFIHMCLEMVCGRRCLFANVIPCLKSDKGT